MFKTHQHVASQTWWNTGWFTRTICPPPVASAFRHSPLLPPTWRELLDPHHPPGEGSTSQLPVEKTYIYIYMYVKWKKNTSRAKGVEISSYRWIPDVFFCWAFFCFNEHHWLVVSTNPLEKYSSNWESFPPKWVWNHHVDITSKVPLMMLSWDCTSSRLQPPLLWEDFAAKCLWQPCCAE